MFIQMKKTLRVFFTTMSSVNNIPRGDTIRYKKVKINVISEEGFIN